jgi:hypothetical protein
MAGFLKSFDWEDIGSWKSAAERNDLGILRYFQQLPDGGTLDSKGTLRVPRLPERRHANSPEPHQLLDA